MELVWLKPMSTHAGTHAALHAGMGLFLLQSHWLQPLFNATVCHSSAHVARPRHHHTDLSDPLSILWRGSADMVHCSHGSTIDAAVSHTALGSSGFAVTNELPWYSPSQRVVSNDCGAATFAGCGSRTGGSDVLPPRWPAAPHDAHPALLDGETLLEVRGWFAGYLFREHRQRSSFDPAGQVCCDWPLRFADDQPLPHKFAKLQGVAGANHLGSEACKTRSMDQRECQSGDRHPGPGYAHTSGHLPIPRCAPHIRNGRWPPSLSACDGCCGLGGSALPAAANGAPRRDRSRGFRLCGAGQVCCDWPSRGFRLCGARDGPQPPSGAQPPNSGGRHRPGIGPGGGGRTRSLMRVAPHRRERQQMSVLSQTMRDSLFSLSVSLVVGEEEAALLQTTSVRHNILTLINGLQRNPSIEIKKYPWQARSYWGKVVFFLPISHFP